MNLTQRPNRAVPLLLVLVLVWAVSWPIVKIGVSSTPPLWYAAYRYLLAVPLMFLYVFLRGQLRFPPTADWPIVLASGGLQMAAYSALTSVALTMLPPGRASVLAFSTPLWVVPLTAWRLRELPTRRESLGVALGLAGAYAIAMHSLETGRSDQLLAYGMLIAAAGMWAVAIVCARSHRFAATTLELSPWQTLLAAALLLPAAALVEGRPRPILPQAIGSLLYVGPIATAFAYWAVLEVSRHIPPGTVSMSLLAVPPLGTLISIPVFHEAAGPALVCGILLIGAGMLFAIGGGTQVPEQRQRLLGTGPDR